MHAISYFPLRVTFTVLQVIGLVCTTWRIYFRLRIDRFWWEDALAAVALLSCLASLTGQWIYLITHGLAPIIGFWVYSLGSTSVIRATHLSILFSIIRIAHGVRLRGFTYLCGAFCGISWIIVISGKIWWCASNPSWHHRKIPSCTVSNWIMVYQFTSDCVTVAILVALPLCMLWRVKLPKRQRRMILAIFASSVVLVFAAVFHTVGHVLSNYGVLSAGVNFEVASSIIVCNLLVVVTYVYRYLWHDGGSVSETTTTSEMDTDDFTQGIHSSALVTQQITTQISMLQSCSDDVDSVYV